jgi:alanyl-tRNA synthetase
MSLSSSELRSAFLAYFASKGHELVPGSSLVPANDPTLLFTNAGMVQFKDVFLGRETRAIRRATSAQPCVRAGGKHNDLENVGYTARHHTFFEMLGNFSFGDYFKREAIGFAWEFVTQVLGLPPERLWCTVYEDDDEAASIWLDEIGVAKGRFTRLGAKDNFWAMGDTGPCGPCTEIFYDHGPDVPGGPPGSKDSEGDRYVEIWNLVFMQFDRNDRGELTPLPKPSVDTGMGLERTAAVLQGVHSNYEIDLFVGLIRAAAAATGTKDLESKSLRVIADHIRASAFLIADGVVPGNEGRGYVLRRIVRRAIRHGYMLGQDRPFFYKLVEPLANEMGAAYPALVARRAHVERVLNQEELRFAETLAQGMRLLEDAIRRLPAGGVIPGDVVFKLHDTYGFPEDLTADIARERSFTTDRSGFDELMEQQRRRAEKASQFKAARSQAPRLDESTEFLGYEMLEADARVVALFDPEGRGIDALDAGARGIVVLDRTPFYAESGGQIGDTGELTGAGSGASKDASKGEIEGGRTAAGVGGAAGASFDVTDTQKLGAAFGHLGVVTRGRLARGDTVHAAVDAERRAAIVLNHSATHLLHAALRRVLGDHVQQKGSLVAPDRLRFDFSHYEAVSPAELEEIERLVNDEIRHNAAADIRVMPYDEAMGVGALAFFGDKYGEKVRVLRLGTFSTELCGGTHVSRAGDIGLFKIVSESGVAAGVRRIEAVTGPGAYEWVAASDKLIKNVAGLVRGGRDEVVDKVSQILERTRSLERENEALKAKLASGGARDLMQDVREVAGTKVLAARLDGADNKALREAVDRIKDKLGSGVVVLGAVDGDKVRLVAGVTKDLADRLPAGRILGPVAERVGGRGGGRPDFAQAGGNDPARLDEALRLVEDAVSAVAQSASQPSR